MDKYQIIIVGWEPGFNKVQTSKFFRAELDDSAADAKLKVDRILKNEKVVISVESPQQLEKIVKNLIGLGAKIQE